MLTDDELANDLGAAFRAETTDLSYRGRTRPPRAIKGALAGGAVVASLAALAIAVGTTGGTAPGDGPSVAASGAVSASPTPVTLTESITLVGYTMKYQRVEGEPRPLYAKLGVTVPADAREIPTTGTEARAWIGKDPKSGDNALYVQAPTRNDGKRFAMLSSTLSQEELISIFRTGEPRTVPAVED